MDEQKVKFERYLDRAAMSLFGVTGLKILKPNQYNKWTAHEPEMQAALNEALVLTDHLKQYNQDCFIYHDGWSGSYVVMVATKPVPSMYLLYTRHHAYFICSNLTLKPAYTWSQND